MYLRLLTDSENHEFGYGRCNGIKHLYQTTSETD